MAAPAAVLNILVTANSAQATSSLARTDAQLKKTAATANAASSSFGSRLATAAKAGAVAVGAIGVVSVKAAVDFDKSMRNVNSIAQLSERRLAQLENRVKSLAGRTAQSPQTLAEGLYDLVSSGFDANESMKVLAASAKAATAGLTTTEVSTKAVAASLNAYRMPASKAEKVSDILFRTVDRGVVSFEELSSTIGDVLPFASSLGVKLEEVGAATATMTKAGISPAETMTRLKAIMSSLLKPSEALTATLQQMGYESGEQIIKAKGLEGTLLALAKATGGSKTEMAALFPNIRALGGALALTGENAGAAKKDLDELRDSAGATNRALSEQSKSVAFQWNKLKAQSQALAINIGDKVIPALRDMLEIVTNKKLTLDEKISKLGVRLTKMIEHWAPKVAEAGAKVGLAIIKGIWGAFWDSDLLGKLFIGTAFIRIIGGPGALAALGSSLGTPVGVAMGLAIAVAAGYEIQRKFKVATPEVKPFFSSDSFKGWLSGIEAQTHQSLLKTVKMWHQNGLEITKDMVYEWQRRGEITSSGAVDLLGVIERLQRQYERIFNALSRATNRTGTDIRDFTGKTADWLKDWSKKGDDAVDRLADALRGPLAAALDRAGDKVKNFTDKATDKIKDFSQDADKSFGKTTGSSARMAKGVGRNVSSLANGVATGLETIKDNLNKSLAAFSVKKVSYSIKKAGNAVGNVVGGFQQGGPVKGALVPGAGSGDKVPLHIGGQLAAMVEPNELVSVTNRTATAQLMAHNKRVPRRQDGGVVPHLAKGGGLMRPFDVKGAQPGFVPFMNFLNSMYGPIYVLSGLRPGSITTTGNVSNHSSGHAVDISTHESGVDMATGPGTLGGPGAARMDALHSYMARNIKLPGDFLWRTFTGGNHYNHIHRGITSSEADDPQRMIEYLSRLPGGAGIATLKRILLQGPKGPLRNAGQGALDKGWKAAKAYLSKHASTGQFGTGKGINIEDLPPKLAKYNHTYPGAMFPSEAWNNLYQMPFNAVAALAEWRGTPGITMAQVSEGEGNLRPGSRSSDNGWGLWGITSPFADSYGVGEFGGYKGMLNPVSNAIVMGRMYPKGWSGGSPWYGTGHVTGYNQHYSGPLLRKYGGLVPHLAKGGKAGDKDLHGTATPGPVTNAFKRFRKARRIAKQLKDLLGERGRVARVDERIANAEALAGLASSEAGSEMSPKELARQIRLNELLLANLVKARKLARSGLGLTRWPKGMSVDKRTEGLMKGLAGGFRSNLVDLTGLTGAGGRIFETKNIIDELKHTTGAGPAALDISGLRSVIEAARYGVFDGYFARGGNLKPGRWGIAGERGPEVVHGPSTVLSPRATQDVLAPKVEVHNEFDFDGLDLYVTTKVNGEIAKRERVNHRRGRQAVR